jgi:hypothetical protein
MLAKMEAKLMADAIQSEVIAPDEVIHIPADEEHVPGFGEIQTVAGGGITEGDAVPEMPPGSDINDYRGGGLDATDTAQPTTTADSTGDRATGLTGLRGG